MTTLFRFENRRAVGERQNFSGCHLEVKLLFAPEQGIAVAFRGFSLLIALDRF